MSVASAPRRTARGSWSPASSRATSCSARPRAGPSASGGSACSAGRCGRRKTGPRPGLGLLRRHGHGPVAVPRRQGRPAGGPLRLSRGQRRQSPGHPAGRRRGVAVDATRFSYRTSPEKPLVQVRDFQGDFVLTTGMLLPVGTKFPARLDIAGDGSRANVLCLGNMFWRAVPGGQRRDGLARRFAAGGAGRDAVVQPQRRRRKRPEERIRPARQPRAGRREVSSGHARAASAARFWEPGSVLPGVTNVRLHRLICTAGKDATCVELRR